MKAWSILSGEKRFRGMVEIANGPIAWLRAR